MDTRSELHDILAADLIDDLRKIVSLTTDIIVVGNISSGKSTFLDALLGKNTFEMGVTSTTKDFSAPLKLRESDLFLIDTPGVNDDDNILFDKKKMEERIKKAMIVFYIVDESKIEDSVTTDYWKFILSVIENNQDLEVCFIVNKVDLLSDPEKTKIELAMTRKLTQLGYSRTTRHRIFYISARDALLATIGLGHKQFTELQNLQLREAFFGRAGAQNQSIEGITWDNYASLLKRSNYHNVADYIYNVAQLSRRDLVRSRINHVNSIFC